MRITDIEVLMYNFPVEESWKEKPSWYRTWHNATTGWERSITDRQEVIVRLSTAEGITGIGAADIGHRHPMIVATVLGKVLKPAVIGEDPLNIERLWQKTYQKCGPMLAGVRGLGYGAIGGVNVACWDILGKKLGAPIYELLGGDPKIPIKPYIGTWTHGWRRRDDINSIVEEAKFYIDQGYEAIKFRGGRGLPALEDIETIKALRSEFPPEKLTLMIDINGGYTWQQALVMAKEFEKCNLFWMEDPFRTRDYKKYVELQGRTSINILIGGGPSSLELKQMLQTGVATNLVSLCTEHGGGISEAMKVATLINLWDLKAAGISHEPLGSLATFHVWISTPPAITEGSFVEYDPMNSCWDLLLTDPPKFKDHRLVLSEKPGLGTDINEEFVKEHPVPSVVSEL